MQWINGQQRRKIFHRTVWLNFCSFSLESNEYTHVLRKMNDFNNHSSFYLREKSSWETEEQNMAYFNTSTPLPTSTQRLRSPELKQFYRVFSSPPSSPSLPDSSGPSLSPSETVETVCVRQSSTKRMYNERWSNDDIEILVSLWKENYERLKNSSRSREVWAEIFKTFDELSSSDQKRSIKNLKDKIHNLTTTYRAAKEKNNRTGESPHFPPFYEDIDSILGCRDSVTLPEVREIGVKRKTLKDASDDESELESDLYMKALQSKKQVNKQPKRARTSKPIKNTSEELHMATLEAFQKSDENHYKFMEALLSDQKQTEERERGREQEERERDRKLFLDLVKILSNN